MSTWSLNAKIYFIVFIFIAACIGISTVGILKMESINDSLNRIVKGPAARVDYAHELRSMFLAQVVTERSLILEDSRSRMDMLKKRMEDKNIEINKVYDSNYKISTNTGKKDLENFKALYAVWWKNSEKISQLALEGNNKEAYSLAMNAGRTARLKAEEVVNGILARNKKFMEEASKQSDEDFASARFFVIIISATSILSGFLFAFFILRAVGRSIDTVISNLDENSNQVTSAAQEIAASSEQLSQAATEQASSLEETASSIEEMNSMVQKTSENANKSATVSDTSKESATKGKQVVQEMISAIDGINDSNREIAEIVKVISEIGNKTKVIHDIVFQTKLLSFNASVEAARAGEHGKGFAVVAEEVGNLAQMSGNAAKEIATLLEGSIQKVERIVNDTKVKVESSTKIAQQCGDVLEEIVNNVSSVTQMVGDISTACQEQSQGVQEITKAMNQLDQVTQDNASTSEETASSAEELSAQADALRDVVKVLISTIKGGKGEHVRTNVSAVSKTNGTFHSTSQQKSKILHLKNAQSSKSRAFNGNTFKMAGGSENGQIPSENDPRFNDV